MCLYNNHILFIHVRGGRAYSIIFLCAPAREKQKTNLWTLRRWITNGNTLIHVRILSADQCLPMWHVTSETIFFSIIFTGCKSKILIEVGFVYSNRSCKSKIPCTLNVVGLVLRRWTSATRAAGRRPWAGRRRWRDADRRTDTWARRAQETHARRRRQQI